VRVDRDVVMVHCVKEYIVRFTVQRSACVWFTVQRSTSLHSELYKVLLFKVNHTHALLCTVNHTHALLCTVNHTEALLFSVNHTQYSFVQWTIHTHSFDSEPYKVLLCSVNHAHAQNYPFITARICGHIIDNFCPDTHCWRRLLILVSSTCSSLMMVPARIETY